MLCIQKWSFSKEFIKYNGIYKKHNIRNPSTLCRTITKSINKFSKISSYGILGKYYYSSQKECFKYYRPFKNAQWDAWLDEFEKTKIDYFFEENKKIYVAPCQIIQPAHRFENEKNFFRELIKMGIINEL